MSNLIKASDYDAMTDAELQTAMAVNQAKRDVLDFAIGKINEAFTPPPPRDWRRLGDFLDRSGGLYRVCRRSNVLSREEAVMLCRELLEELSCTTPRRGWLKPAKFTPRLDEIDDDELREFIGSKVKRTR